jgi:chemotaxis protein MotB
MSRRRQKKHEHVNHERWLVSYADFITLLFAFFVVMFAASQVDSAKLGRFVESTNRAFHVSGPFTQTGSGALAGGGGSSVVPVVVSPQPTFLVHPSPSQEARDLAEAVRRDLEELGASARAKVRQDPRGVVVSIAERDCFAPASAELGPAALSSLRLVAKAIDSARGLVQVEVHGEPAPLATGFDPKAWDLSASRAARIARFLQDEAGFRPEDLSATGLVAVRPASGDGVPLGARIDLVLVTEGGG